MAETRDKRIVARVEPALYRRVAALAAEAYEGNESMAARALIREALDRRERAAQDESTEEAA